MPRRRRPKRPDSRLNRPVAVNPGWRWRTLPVWLALTGGFVAGWYVGTYVRDPRASVVIMIVAVSAFSFGLSRITRWMMERSMMRRRARKAAAVGGADATGGRSA